MGVVDKRPLLNVGTFLTYVHASVSAEGRETYVWTYLESLQRVPDPPTSLLHNRRTPAMARMVTRISLSGTRGVRQDLHAPWFEEERDSERTGSVDIPRDQPCTASRLKFLTTPARLISFAQPF